MENINSLKVRIFDINGTLRRQKPQLASIKPLRQPRSGFERILTTKVQSEELGVEIRESVLLTLIYLVNK